MTDTTPKHTPTWTVQQDFTPLRPWPETWVVMSGTLSSGVRVLGNYTTKADAHEVCDALAQVEALKGALRAVRACEKCGEDYGRCMECDRRMDAALLSVEPKEAK